METKEKLLQAAKLSFSEKGYWKTKISDIVKEAGVSQGTFYIYFKSKEDIFKELVIQVKERMISSFDTVQGSSFKEKLEKLDIDLTYLLYENKEITAIFLYQLFSTYKDLRMIYFETMEIIKKKLSNMIREAIENKEIKVINSENAADIFIGYKRMIFEDFILQKNYPLKDVLKVSKEGINIIYAGLKR